jgi:thiol-disulfide isomerase/thioredoxin
MRLAVAIPAIALAAACTRSEQPSEQPVGRAEPVVSAAESPAAASGAERAALASAGYFGAAEAKKAWKAEAADCPGAADGSEMIGRRLDRWQLSDWVASEPLDLAELRGRVVVVRFWTSPGCPFCEKTLPALQKLADEMKGEPVTFVGAFHAKPVDAYSDMEEPAGVAARWGVSFPLAMDREWKTLRQWWLGTGHRHATSVTFVIGKSGEIVHIHPGPVFHPSDDPAEADQDRDYRAVKAAIERALRGP